MQTSIDDVISSVSMNQA